MLNELSAYADVFKSTAEESVKYFQPTFVVPSLGSNCLTYCLS
ncbi:MAG: hypothetical protein ACJATE_002381 [Bacteroidia bacterium]|jgi:hypothetical protein